MKNIIAICICSFLFAFPIFAQIDGVIKITDRESILSHTEGENVWDPGNFNRSEFEKLLRKYLLGDTKKSFTVEPEYILKSLSEYRIEYAGIVRAGNKLIVCQMILGRYDLPEEIAEVSGESSENKFSMIFDGGCDIVEVIYDPKKQKIVELSCNGVA